MYSVVWYGIFISSKTVQYIVGYTVGWVIPCKLCILYDTVLTVVVIVLQMTVCCSWSTRVAVLVERDS